MTIVPVPWIELAILAPLIGAFWVRLLRDPDVARQHSLWISGFSFASSTIAWRLLGDSTPGIRMAREQWDVVRRLLGSNVFVIDELSAPLLPLTALLFLLTVLATLRTKVRRFSFGSMLVSESILLATLACRQPWAIVALLAAGTIPPWRELRDRNKPTRVFVVHMALFVALLVAGQAIQSLGG